MSDTREHAVELKLEQSPEAVWQALTDPVELARWFPIEAQVEPGEGGRIRLGWGPELESVCTIQEWQPGRRLRTGWFEQPAGRAAEGRNREEAARIAVDYTLESRDGSTLLRLVHSGYSTKPAWDDEYDAVGRGWRVELACLKHYLEHHRGQDRRLIWSRTQVTGAAAAAWRQLAAIGNGGLGGREVGAGYELQVTDDELWAGVVRFADPPHELAATVDTLNQAWLRLAIDSCFGRPEAHIWLSTWGLSNERLDALKEICNDTLKCGFARVA